MARFRGKLSSLDKVNLFLGIFIILSLIFAIIISTLKGDLTSLFLSVLALFLTFSPTLFEWKYNVEIPEEFEIMVLIFIYAALFLGEVSGYYTVFWWWDLVLHTSSGLAFGFIGFMILLALYKGTKIKANPFILVVFSFSFALAIGTLWEILEFFIDISFGYTAQGVGIADTMTDLIVDAIGAFIASVFGYIYLKGGKGHLFDKLVGKFIVNNPSFFKN